jgi:hypothetical protein
MVIGARITSSRTEWWANDPAEKFWLEATDRKDVGADLKAPLQDASRSDNWRYSLFKRAKVGDIVLHYDKNPGAGGIVGWSFVAGAWTEAPIIWAARGTFAKARGDKPTTRAGYSIPLTDFHRMPHPVTLDMLRRRVSDMKELVESIHEKHGRRAAPYFPFDVSGVRDLRLLQGYGFKLPRQFLSLFPEFSSLLSEHDLPPLPPDEADRKEFDPVGIIDARERVTRGIKARRGRKSFRDALIAVYGGRCAITGCGVQDVLEAAHITPYLGSETNHVTNGLLLRADLHTLLDCGLIAIDPTTRKVILAPPLRSSADYAHLHGQPLRCASPKSASPSLKALAALLKWAGLNSFGAARPSDSRTAMDTGAVVGGASHRERRPSRPH